MFRKRTMIVVARSYGVYSFKLECFTVLPHLLRSVSRNNECDIILPELASC